MATERTQRPPESKGAEQSDMTQSVCNVRLVGGGEFANRFQPTLLTYLQNAGVVSPSQNPVGDISLETTGDSVDLDVSVLDVDFDVTNELKHAIDDPAMRQYLENNQLTLIGGGAGREWRRMLNYFEEYPQLDEFLTESVTADPHTHMLLPMAGMTGATGMGTIRRLITRIREGSLPSAAEHPGVILPITVGPNLRVHDQWVNAIDADRQRRAFENVSEHLPWLRRAVQDNLISGLVFADNAQLDLLQRTHHERVPISELKQLQVPIRSDDNWLPFIRDYRYNDAYDAYANNGARNAALARSLIMPIYSGLRPPELHFDSGDNHFDHNDYFGALSGVTWLPGHIWLDDYAEISSLVPDVAQPSSVDDALYPAAQYATQTIPAGFNNNSASRAMVFAHVSESSLPARAHGVLSRTVADELGIPAADVTTVEVNGMQAQHFPGDADPDLALNVMVGVDELEVTYQALSQQTLDGME